MKNFIYSLFLVMFITVLGCRTMIPEVDTIAPEFSFKISGDGFNRTFTQDDDFDRIQLNLKENALYHVLYSGSDQGGVRLIQWQLPDAGVVQVTTPVESPWSIRDLSALSRMIEWNGNVSSPSTGSLLAKRILLNSNGADGLMISFRFFVSDFGGTSESSNSVSKVLQIQIGNHDTEVVSL